MLLTRDGDCKGTASTRTFLQTCLLLDYYNPKHGNTSHRCTMAPSLLQLIQKSRINYYIRNYSIERYPKEILPMGEKKTNIEHTDHSH